MVITSKEFALAIRNVRKERGFSQIKIGSLVGLRQATISGFENHPEQTQLATVFRLLAALDLELKLVPRHQAKDNGNWKEEW